MSDESEVTPLRLKRSNAASAPAAVPVGEGAASVETGSGSAVPVERTGRRLSLAGDAGEGPVEAAAEMECGEAGPVTGVVSSLKLRVGVRPVPPSDAVNTPPPFDPAKLSPPVVVTTPVDEIGVRTAPPLLPLPSPAASVGGPVCLAGAAPAVVGGNGAVKTHPRRDLLIFLLLLVLLSAGAFWGYRSFFGGQRSLVAVASSADAPMVELRPAASVGGMPAPVSMTPEGGGGRLVVVAGSAQGEGLVVTAAATGLEATLADAAGSEPSATFRRYAEGLRVSGVFQGATPRALIDGRVVREGELLDLAAGIRFVGVDVGARQVLIQDGSGAVLRVKY